MKQKSKANNLALVILGLSLSLLHRLRENGSMQVQAAITKHINRKCSHLDRANFHL